MSRRPRVIWKSEGETGDVLRKKNHFLLGEKADVVAIVDKPVGEEYN